MSARSRSRTIGIARRRHGCRCSPLWPSPAPARRCAPSADNPELAALKGIDPERVARLASFVGMGLAGIGGMLLGLDTLDRSADRLPRILCRSSPPRCVGGLGSVPGAVLGAFLIGIAEELSLLVVCSPPTAPPSASSPSCWSSPCGRAACWRGRFAMFPEAVQRPSISELEPAPRRWKHAELPPRHRDLRRHLRAAGARPQLIWGMAGMVNLGLVGFFAFGAYVSALLTTKRQAPRSRSAGRRAGRTAVRRRWWWRSSPRGCATTISPSSRWASPRWCASSPATRSG